MDALRAHVDNFAAWHGRLPAWHALDPEVLFRYHVTHDAIERHLGGLARGEYRALRGAAVDRALTGQLDDAVSLMRAHRARLSAC